MTYHYCTIRFYGAKEPFGEFSNFYPSQITMGGKVYQTTEHYFQSMKTNDLERHELIRNASTPGNAARLGRARRATKLRSDWDAVKVDIMYEACWAKFTQHPDLARKLIDTGDARLVEHTKLDKYWGDGGDGEGLNQLGEVLMRVRDGLARLDSKALI